MNKIWLVFQREYLNFVRKRSFLLSTFLVPLAFVAIFGIQILVTLNVEKENYTLLIASDDAPEIAEQLTNAENLSFQRLDLPLDSLRSMATRDKQMLVLSLGAALTEQPEGSILVQSQQNLSQPVVKQIEKQVQKAVEAYRQAKVGITPEQLAATRIDLDVQTRRLSGKEGSENLASAVGLAMGFLMYMLMAAYGSILMQAVIDEKSNRIVEVMVSSLRPFQLLMGKILGVAAVGLTQFMIWLASLFLISVAGGLVLGASGADPAVLQQPGVDTAAQMDAAQKLMIEMQNFNWAGVLLTFPIYFLGGFFLYGSLMAAAGAAVDNIQDAQQFTTPIIMPLIIPMLFIYNIVQNPNSLLAKIFSMVPFFSPMTMQMRLAMSEVPWYEVALSILLLIGAFLGCVWLAARIYRVGILMYGKKPSWKELVRWVSYRA
jgi:ABC-2 type transport system permease protein